METAKDLFLKMREKEAFELTATKKSIIETSENFVKNIFNSGKITKQEALAIAIRNATFWQNTAEKIKLEFNENDNFFGIELKFANGRKIINYEEDEIYNYFKNKLKEREELLKLAQKQEVLDTSGNLVPKVSIKYAKDSLQTKIL